MCSHVTVTRSWKRLWLPAFQPCPSPALDDAPYCASHLPAPLASGLRRVRQGGQALTEMALGVALFVIVCMGVVEFGYTFFALHAVTQSTSAGARIASVLQMGNRGKCGLYSDSSSANDTVKNFIQGQVGSVLIVNTVSVQQCDGDTCPANGTTCASFGTTLIPKVVVTVTGSIPSVFGLYRSGPISFTRVQVFRDEGRG